MVGTGSVDRGKEEGERWNCAKADGMGAGMWWASIPHPAGTYIIEFTGEGGLGTNLVC
jgi:hypothetical protein